MAPRPATIIALSVQELILKELVLYEFVMVPTKCCVNFFRRLVAFTCLEKEKFQQAVAAALFRIHQRLGRAGGRRRCCCELLVLRSLPIRSANFYSYVITII